MCADDPSKLPLSAYNNFVVVEKLRFTKPYYAFKDEEYSEITSETTKKCPFCDKYFQESEISKHIENEISNQQKGVTVIFDKMLGIKVDRMCFECNTVRELKKIIFDRTGFSASKIDIYKDDELLTNNMGIDKEIVHAKKKKR